MSEAVFLLSISLVLVTILLVFGMRAFSAIQQAKVRNENDEAYREIAEKAVAAASENTTALSSIHRQNDPGIAVAPLCPEGHLHSSHRGARHRHMAGNHPLRKSVATDAGSRLLLAGGGVGFGGFGASMSATDPVSVVPR
jgi:hypothetical protein